LQIEDGSVLNRGAEITSTNFEYGNIQINNGDVKYGARIDTRDVHTSSKSSGFTISAGINSPIKDRIKQAAGAVSQVKNGDTAGGAMEAVNAAAGTIKGLSENITKRDGTRATMNDIEKGDFKVNNDFYVSGNIRAGFNKSKSSTASHTESAAVTTMKPLNENSSITYNNVNNITYQGTQAQGGTFIYNNVANIQKEAVELRNSYSSESSGFGVGVSAGIGSNGQIKPNGISGNVSTNRSNQNTVETVYANGNFKNVNEVHNNTGSMTLSGFNQEGGKVTGNIGKLIVESRQNTSTTTGSSSGIGVGISANGMPSSVNVSGSKTNGNRAFVDNQSSFIVGEGSDLHIGTLDNTAGIIGKEGNSKLTVDKYTGHDLQNKDEMTINGASIGVSIGNNSSRLSNIGISSENRDKQGITRNTVIGDVEIGQASGDPINRDRAKANEITKDTHSKTNVNVESQTLDYLANPEKFKQDLDIAILEGQITADGAIKKIENIVNGRKNSDIGDPEIRKFEDMKDYYLRAKTAPDIDLLVKADLSDKEVQEQLGIGGKFNPDDPNLPQKVKDRIADARKNQGKEIPYFYDKVTGKIYINENADVNTVKAGIAREWAIREQLEAGNGKENNEGKPKATVAGEIAYDEVMKRTKGQDNSNVFSGIDYGQLDENSEVTSDGSKVAKLNAISTLGFIGTDYDKIQKKLIKMKDEGASISSIHKELFYLSIEGGSGLGSMYEGIYVINNKVLRNKFIDSKNNLHIEKFDPEGLKRVENTKLYKNIVNEAIDIGIKLYKREGANVKNGQVGAGYITNPEHCKLAGSDDIWNVNSLEYALGKTKLKASIHKKVVYNKDKSVTLNVYIKYQISDRFENPIGIKGAPEWGKAYDMLGPERILPLTRGGFPKRFNSVKEFQEYEKKQRLNGGK